MSLDTTASPRSNVNLDRLLTHLRAMWRIRAFEKQALAGLEEKLVLGAIHPSIGQEAIAVGVCAHLERGDVLLSTHRGHGHTLAKGAAPLPMMRELFGREGGNCGGKGGSMHIADFDVGMLGANGVVAANIVIAAGAAHAVKLKNESKVVCCFFGDGAINRGPFLEGLNWAKVFDLPVLFVCEDNGFAATTRTRALTGGDGPSARARSIGLMAEEVDGNDIMAVDAAAKDLVAAIRSGGGPRFLHARTYRLTGHTGSDPALYRTKEELAERWQQDPIARATALLGERPGEADQIRAAAESEMLEAYQAAKATGFPPSSKAFHDVQDAGDPRQEAF